MSDTFREEVHALLAYTVSSAAGCVREPRLYGPMRLADVAARTIRLLERHDLLRQPALGSVAARIERDKLLCMDDEAGFAAMLRDVSAAMADILSGEVDG